MDTTALHKIAVQVATNGVSGCELDKKDLPEVEVDGAKYRVVAVREDMGVRDMSSSVQHIAAVRVHLDCIAASHEPNLDSGLQPRTFTIAAHVFAIGCGATTLEGIATAKSYQSHVIVDTDSLREALETSPATGCSPLQAASIEVLPSEDPESPTATRKKYEAYIGAINERHMTQSLPTYCHDVILHNGKALHLPEYQQLMEGAQAVIADLEFDIANLVVDSEKSIVAAKLDFRGRPMGEFAGVTPLAGSAKEVRFSEIVFYWFKSGKIAQVVSLVDLDEYRQQVVTRNL